jgi:hypothetical protein
MEESNFTAKVRWMAAAAAAFFVLLVLFLYALTRERIPVTVVNADAANGRVSSDDLDSIRLRIASEYLDSDVSSADIAIRWSSFIQDGENKYFLIDIDAIKQTYFVSYIDSALYLSCPELGQSKYPDSYCHVVELDGESTISNNLGEYLPYDGEVNGIEYLVDESSEESGKLYYHIYECKDDNIVQPVLDDFKTVIEGVGLDANIFGYEIEFNDCD